ncbi:MAG: choice-of-anchor T family protein, partial [Candidatus Thermoplasmatota archaeon]|nr:choice-of-anchor T family protein [Candidatus Thermoplasmatota archaeon]
MSRPSRAVWTVGLLLASLLLVAAPSAQAQIGIGVQIDCDGDPELNVAPSENEDVVITCTVSNSGQLESTISVDYEWQDDDPRVDMSLSEDEFTLAAGAEEEFEATFSGSPRIEADLSLDFDIIASISSVMVLPVDQLNQSATYSGELTIATFGQVDLTLTDRSTRNLEVSEEVSIGFTIGNDGNAEDKIEVNIANLAELEGAGFSFPEGSFVAETVMVEGTSAERAIVL